jgi:hypothetical protein
MAEQKTRRTLDQIWEEGTTPEALARAKAWEDTQKENRQKWRRSNRIELVICLSVISSMLGYAAFAEDVFKFVATLTTALGLVGHIYFRYHTEKYDTTHGIPPPFGLLAIGGIIISVISVLMYIFFSGTLTFGLTILGAPILLMIAFLIVLFLP